MLTIKKRFYNLSDADYMKVFYEYYSGKKLDLENPIEFNEKIHWMKVYFRPPILHQLVDKYAVRSYVAFKIGDEYLNELLGVYNSFEEINFEELPDRFVLKGAHGCKYNLIVKDKSKLDLQEAEKLCNKWLGRDYSERGGREWAYKGVPRRIVADYFLEQGDGRELLDYKIYCFNGKPAFTQAIEDTIGDNLRGFYSLDWTKMDMNKTSAEYRGNDFPRPKNYEKMLEIAEILAANFPFVRVDLYNIDGRIIFGELTFYPSNGRSSFKPVLLNGILNLKGDY